MRVAYGSSDYEHNKRLAMSAAEVVSGIFTSMEPAVMLVNTIHALRYVPAWMPGAGWRRRLHAISEHSQAVINDPYNLAREQVRTGGQIDSSALAVQFMGNLPKESDPQHTYEDSVARNVAAIAFLGGADTSISSALAMILGLTMNPHLQRRAQKELDAVVGVGQLPTTEDVRHLPFIQAIVKETLRWHNVIPLSLPHVAHEADTYKGHRIPAGTAVMVNVWTILHDPKVFDSPLEFRPERYLKDGKLDPSVRDPDTAVFGHGRRVCPGRHFSEINLHLLAASLLSCFNLEQALGADGKPLPLELFCPTGAILTPAPFPCKIVPRSQLHVDLIRSCQV